MDDMSEAEQAKLFEWTRVLTTVAFDVGYITRKWRASDEQCLRMRGYYQAGLSPSEAADGLFGVMH